jgi:hypothetical protein
MGKKKTFVILFAVILTIVSFLGALLYKPIKSTIAYNQLLSMPPVFVYTKSDFRYCMAQTGNSTLFTEMYIQIRSTVEKNKEAQRYLKEYYENNK